MSETADKKDPLKLARERYKRGVEAEQENRKHAKEALKFRNLEQWPETVKTAREAKGQPCLIVDKTNQYINQVKNDQRQNRPSIKVRPVDDKGDPEIAEIYQGIVRHIEDTSKADLAYDTAFEQALDGGFGYFRILTDYCDEMSFDQDIQIKRIRNRFSVVLDPDRQEPDGLDAKWGFIVDEITRDEHKAQFKGAELVDFKDADEEIKDWHSEKNVRIAEYFFYRPKEVEIALLEDGTVIRDDDEGYKPKGLKVVKTRKTTINEVIWQKINGKEILEERVWPGKWIPIVEVIGNELDIEGKRITSGMLKSAMDQQRMHNYANSAFVENVALAPKAPWTIAEGQSEGYEDDWRNANKENLSALTYKPTTVDGHLVPAPQRQPPPGIPAGWLQVMQNSEQGIQGAFGMYQASIGAPSNEKSGKAILARQREGDTATFHYIDNLSRSIRHLGRIIVDLIPKIYDTQRVARILGEDGSPDHARLNPDQPVAVEKIVTGKGIEKIYNLGIGKYDVTVSTGPSYTTKRQEAAEAMVQILQGNPELMQTIGDLAFKNMDWPGADEIAERLKKMLPPQLQEDEEGQPQQDPQMVAMIEQLQGQLQEAIKAAEGKQQELELKAAEVKVKQFDAETKRLQVMGAFQEQRGELELQLNTLAEMVSGLIAKQGPQQQPEAA